MKCDEKDVHTLKKAPLGENMIVTKIDDTLGTSMLRRLGDLGIVEGTNITVIKKSFLGKTLLVSLNGYTLSFRDTVAEIIKVKEVS